MKIGDRIKEFRDLKDITQEDLAKAIGVKRSTVANWEINRSSPGYEDIRNIAKVLGVGVEKIVGEVPDNTSEASNGIQVFTITPKEIQMLNKMRLLSPAAQRAVLEMIDNIYGIETAKNEQSSAKEEKIS